MIKHNVTNTNTNVRTGTNHWIILCYFILCAVLYLMTAGDVTVLSGVFSIAFLMVLLSFGFANMKVTHTHTYIHIRFTSTHACTHTHTSIQKQISIVIYRPAIHHTTLHRFPSYSITSHHITSHHICQSYQTIVLNNMKLKFCRPRLPRGHTISWPGVLFGFGAMFAGLIGVVLVSLLARYSAVQHSSWYDMIWYDMIWYDMMSNDMIRHDILWYDVIWHDTTRHDTTRRCVLMLCMYVLVYVFMCIFVFRISVRIPSRPFSFNCFFQL